MCFIQPFQFLSFLFLVFKFAVSSPLSSNQTTHRSLLLRMAAKRLREDFEASDMANCLVLLSHGVDTTMTRPHTHEANVAVFECKTCNRQFSSFQALGGHRASHKRPKTIAEEPKDMGRDNKHKMHECTMCGLEFSSGQALGGHMRRHRVTTVNGGGFSPVAEKFPVLKRSGSIRVMCLDLNLTPLENDLKLLFGKMAPRVDLVL